jgi:DNA modification methylase
MQFQMEQLNLLDDDRDGDKSVGRKGKGPPNRMNDLPYRDWMKFQKSFFRHKSDVSLLRECVEFFTKATWPNGESSRSLLIGFNEGTPSSLQLNRIIEECSAVPTLDDLMTELESRVKKKEKFDYVMIDLRSLIKNDESLARFLAHTAARLFTAMRTLLFDDRYCGIVAQTNAHGGNGFPYPWSIALASRDHLRLRDEKIGLIEATGNVYYCLFMQAKDDERHSYMLSPEDTRIVSSSRPVPGWVVPKPPPRKKHEVLHPAKFPETLIEGFIDVFTTPGATVFDPMVGTGSTVVAALRKHRNGIGVDLNSQFIETALRRIKRETVPELFEDRNVFGVVLQGDATQLHEIPQLRGQQFEYAITSPPYWSMLTNPGSENQAARRNKNLPLVYSDDKADLGNVEDYDEFLKLLESVYSCVADKLVPGGVLTVVVKNVKRNHVLYPLAWDLTARLCGQDGKYDYVGNTMWCQDDVGLKPFAVGIHWVSNILHQYCLHYCRRE